MKVIWKFTLEMTQEQYVAMPAGADILSAHVQDGRICLWGLVDDSKPTEPRHIKVYGTGQPVSHAIGRFIGTIMLEITATVFHVFEVEE